MMEHRQIIANRIAQAVLSYQADVSFETFGKRYLGYETHTHTYKNEFAEDSIYLTLADIFLSHKTKELEVNND